MRVQLLVFMLIIGVLCFVALPVVEAVTITIDGTTTFNSGGFESDTVGKLPSNTTVGTWVNFGNYQGSTTYNKVVDDATPGAMEGTKYIYELFPYAAVYGFIESTLSSPATSGENVVAEYSLYIRSIGGDSWSLDTSKLGVNFLRTGTSTAAPTDEITYIRFGFPGCDLVTGSYVNTNGMAANEIVVAGYYGGGWHNVQAGDANMYITTDEWHSMKLDLVVGGTYTLTIDDLASDPMTVYQTFDVRGMAFFGEGSAVSAYIDAREVMDTTWLTGWDYRRQITIDHTKVDENLTNFPALVRLSSDNFNFDLARADGYDVRFTAGTNSAELLAFERELHDATSKEAVYWVKVPVVDNAIDTTIYLYFGNSAAVNAASSAAVWSSKYAGVWHLGDMNGVTQNDSGSGGNDGNIPYALDAEGIDGAIGRAVRLDSASTNHIVTGLFTFDAVTDGVTLSTWAKPTTTGIDTMMHIGCGYNHSPYSFVHINHSGTDTLNVQTRLHPNYIDRSVTGFATGVWSHVVTTVYYDSGADETTMKLYLNGVEVDTDTQTGQRVYNPGSYPVRLGARYRWHISTPENLFDGELDESRLFKGIRSAAWISACYENQKIDGALLLVGHKEPTIGLLIIIQ